MAWTPPDTDEVIGARKKGGWMPPETDELVTEPRSAVDVAMKSITTHDVPAAPADESVRDMLARLLKDAYSPEGFKMEDQLSLTAGKAGPGRFLESEGKRVGGAVRAAGKNLAEKFVELPGVNKFPKAAATVGSAGSAVTDFLSDSLTPSSQQLAVGMEPIISGAKAAEMGVTSRMAQKLSGIPEWLARIIRREGPAVLEGGKGTPESVDAAMAGIRDVIEKNRTTAGEAVSAEKSKLGLPTTLREKAEALATQGPDELTVQEAVRQALGALDPAAPKGRESIPQLLRLQEQIDNLVSYGRKGLTKVGSSEDAMLKELRHAIGERLSNMSETPFKKSVMGVESGVREAEPVKIAEPLQKARAAYANAADVYEGLRPKFETTPKGIQTVKTQMQEGLRSVDPDVKALEGIPGGAEALGKAKTEVTRFLLETADVGQPSNTATLIAQTLGLSPKNAAKFIALTANGDRMAASYPKLFAASKALSAAAARGTQAVSSTDYILQQQDPEYRMMMNTLKDANE